MLNPTDILVLALDDGKIIEVARAVTDFNYACYLSDIAVGFYPKIRFTQHGSAWTLVH